MTRILIAGLGSIGRRHLRNLVALGETDIILLRSHRGTLPDEELKGFAVETELHEALKKHKPDAVIVANPTALHLEAAIPAAAAGCAILLEKPISHNLIDLDRLQSAAEGKGARVLVGFQFRFHPSLLRVKDWAAAGELGRLIAAHVHFGEYLPAWHPWEDYRKGYAARADLGGGVLLTQCHSLDYLPWLVGEVSSVWGFLGKLSDLDVDVEDTAEIGLRFAGGALGSLHLDYAQQPPSHRLQIIGTRGSLECDVMLGASRIYRSDRNAWDEYRLPDKWERNDMFMDEMKHFLAVARGEAVPACSLEDGIRVMKLIAAVRASQDSGRLVSLAE